MLTTNHCWTWPCFLQNLCYYSFPTDCLKLSVRRHFLKPSQNARITCWSYLSGFNSRLMKAPLGVPPWTPSAVVGVNEAMPWTRVKSDRHLSGAKVLPLLLAQSLGEVTVASLTWAWKVLKFKVDSAPDFGRVQRSQWLDFKAHRAITSSCRTHFCYWGQINNIQTNSYRPEWQSASLLLSPAAIPSWNA